jgi:hypothetical protein
VTAMLLLARAGEWHSDFPLPVALPKRELCEETLRYGITEVMFCDTAWSVDALCVLLSLGVPPPDVLTLNELLSVPCSFEQHTRAVADHFATEFIAYDELVERLRDAFERIVSCSLCTMDSNSHWMTAQLLMYVFFRLYLKNINLETWMCSMLSLMPLEPELSTLSLKMAVREEFHKLAKC